MALYLLCKLALCKTFLIFVISHLPVFHCTSDEGNQVGTNYDNGNPHNLKITSVQAEFGVKYRCNVKYGTMYTYLFKLTSFQAGKAVRVHVGSPKAEEKFPVLFVVKEQKDVISWQVPLILDDVYSYYHISRTLCPTGNIGNGTTISGELSLDVFTMSEAPIDVVLELEISEIQLNIDNPIKTAVTPSEPKIYRYNFGPNENTVLVKMHSPDTKCMVLSIQTTKCPVYDETRNVEFTGFYQTVDGRGAITVRKSWFSESEEFFVVLVVKPHDYDCTGFPPHYVPGLSEKRVKTLTLKVVPDITDEEYIIATTAATAWFMFFYLIALIISCVYHYRDNGKNGVRNNGMEPSVEPLLSSSGIHSPLAEERHISYQYGTAAGTSTADTPVDGADSYLPPEQSSPTRTQNFKNGIPHRIPPPHEIDSDFTDIDDKDTDLLEHGNDPEHFRSKTFLYVSDLARKPRRVLSKKYKLYYWNIVTIVIFYGLPVIQLVITYQKVLNVTGNEDICYYNFDCAHRVGVISAFNNVFSNIGYIMLGVLFLILVYRRDNATKKLIEKNDRYEKHYGIPQHYGLFYAMGIALAMEGVLSACYHVCPSYSNFQFDTSFMYMIGWLCMLKIYQTRHPDINAHAHVAYFAISIVIFLAVLGVFAYPRVYYYVLYFVIHVFSSIILSLHLYNMGRWTIDRGVFKRIYLMIKTDKFSCIRPMYMDRMILLVFGNLTNWSLAICGVVFQPKDFASYLLSIFMINLLMYFAFYLIMKIRSKEKILPVPLIFIILTGGIWIPAGYFFSRRLTSWELMPAESRNYNSDCVLFGFYDSHDIWHFLSATSLFLGFMILFTMDDDLVYTPRDRIPVF